jgi:hypothetical protein
MLPQDAYEEKNAAYRRAKSLYLRGRDYTFRAIDVRHPDFSSSLASGDFEKAFTGFAHEDVPSLHYASAGIFGAFSCDTMDFKLSFAIPRAFACAAKALELDETWNAGAVHELFISLYGSLPEAMMFRVSEDEGKKTRYGIFSPHTMPPRESPGMMPRQREGITSSAQSRYPGIRRCLPISPMRGGFSSSARTGPVSRPSSKRPLPSITMRNLKTGS